MSAWQGTPGPWRVSPTQNRDRPFAIVAQGRFTVAFSCTFGRDATANAKGIAAVPELVEASSEVLQWVKANGFAGPRAARLEAALISAGVKL